MPAVASLLAVAIPAMVQQAGTDLDEARLEVIGPVATRAMDRRLARELVVGLSLQSLAQATATVRMDTAPEAEPDLDEREVTTSTTLRSTGAAGFFGGPEFAIPGGDTVDTGTAPGSVDPSRQGAQSDDGALTAADRNASPDPTLPPSTTTTLPPTTTAPPGTEPPTSLPPSTTVPPTTVPPTTVPPTTVPPPPPPPCSAKVGAGAPAAESRAFAFDGQSNSLHPTPEEAYPAKVMARLYPGRPFAVTAVGGTTFTQRSARAPERLDRYPSGWPCMVLFAEGGTSDILEGATASEVVERIRSYLSGRQAAGYDAVVFSTMLPGTFLSPSQEITRRQLNDLLRSGYSDLGIDVLVDIAAIPQLQDPTDRDYYNEDGAHVLSSATTLMADRYAAALGG